MEHLLYCLDSVPNLLGIFDTTIAPSLLYYSYIPIAIVSLMFGFLVFYKTEKKSIQSKLLLGIAISFSIYIINEIVQWVAVPVAIVHFGWEISPLLQTAIFLSSFYFVLVFVNKGDIPFVQKIVMFLVLLPVLILLPTDLNMQSFDLINCQSNIGLLFYYVYFVQIILVLLIPVVCVKKYLKVSDVGFKNEILFIMTGAFLFLATFTFSNIFGEITKTYEINLIGPIGMIIFLGFLAYMIVRFHTFDMKLLATQTLVWILATMIGSQFFFIKVPVNFVLNSVTFVAILFFGQLLIESVKNEVKQREYLEKLNINLENLIKQRESLVHLITHKVKGLFTRSKFLFAEMLEGSFGQLPETLNSMTKRAFDSDVEGIATIDLVLNSANLQNGTVKYDMKPTDFKDLISKLATEKKVSAEAKGLKMDLLLEEGDFNIMGDAFWLKEVIVNLLENSIRYSKVGTITVNLQKNDKKVLLSVKDTGIGITDEDKKNLFKEGGRGKDSVKINVDSTGYGLFSVKLIVEAHKGRIWAESEGADKGSAFYVELEAIK
ncbi:MAG: HAMP domain-containing sensor histidine kinase [Candidatus Nomurabacteria bacterium]|nr:HAMP domain-containing sensor histidine kinase [Candidatus Nomurabacteria bacterium]